MLSVAHLLFQPVNIVEDEENWEAENFCLKMLCENEEVGDVKTLFLVINLMLTDDWTKCWLICVCVCVCVCLCV